MRQGSYFALILALAAASTATAQTPAPSGGSVARVIAGAVVRLPGFPQQPSKEADAARSFQQLRVAGRDVRKAVKKIRKLKWHRSLDRAQVQARRQNKPILWIQALGKLKGYT